VLSLLLEKFLARGDYVKKNSFEMVYPKWVNRLKPRKFLSHWTENRYSAKP
jgi:hypothetical protein